MKLLLFTGTHKRHKFLHSEVLAHCDEALCVTVQREDVLPQPPKNISQHDKKLFTMHFENRKKIEDEKFKCDNTNTLAQYRSIQVQPNELNTLEVAKEVKDFDADMAFIFGGHLILDPVLSVLPENKINMHLGLSPWYRGAATLFWPFYFLQPQFAGVTFHQIIESPDAGEIIHQCVPQLFKGQTIHEVSANCIIQAKDDISLLFNHWKNHKCFNGKIQKTTGRVWRGRDFHPSHLRVIYDLFEDKMVDSYLSGELEQSSPNLFSCLK